MAEACRTRCVALAVGMLVLAFAGCFGASNDSDPTGSGLSKDVKIDTTAPAGAGSRSPDLVPVWSVGDYWTYRGSDGDQNTFVVTAVGDTDYFIDTTADDFAFFNAVDPVSTMGPQRVRDLAGSQGDTRVEFFHWPLKDAETWTTTWDGETVSIEAATQNDGSYRYTATNASGGIQVTYAYDPEVRWFTELSFWFGGELAFTNKLVESGTAWTGDVLRYTVETVYEGPTPTGAPVPGGAEAVKFTQSESHTDVHVAFSAACAAGVLTFVLAPGEPTEETTGYSSNDPCPKTDAFFDSVGSQPGDWGITVVLAHDLDAVWSAAIRLRTLETIPVT